MKGPGFDLVLKVGGSLGRRPRRLAPLMRRVADLARRVRLVVLPGGGVFADLVRAEMDRLGLEEARAHRMALLAMDQYGLALARFCPGARPVTTLEAARRLAAAGRAPILLASALLGRERRLEKSFRLTSDSIAAYVAKRTRVPRLALLKSTTRPDGRLRTPEEARRLARRGVVDPLFPGLLPRGLEVWVLNGRRAEAIERLAAAPARRPDPARPRLAGPGSRRRRSTAGRRAARRGTG
ncbi:MAG TPA: hypothetical protein VFB95_13740 [Candidatus Cryosericum sp.]|nr:hypothetical protein [Candidatus Cryosericum sp.]